MRGVLRLVAAVLLALLGVGGGAALASPTAATLTHAHDASYVVAASANQLERGPPVTRAHDAVSGSDYAVDHRSDGPSACAGLVAPIQYTTYICTARLVATGSASVTDTEATIATGWRVQVSHRMISSLAQSRVATNTVTRAPQVLRVGELKLPAVPKGATGTPSKYGDGLEYAIPRGTPELDPRVASIRIMGPRTTGKYQYPNGLAVYQNAQGQRVNPLTGQMIHDLSDPFAHIPLP